MIKCIVCDLDGTLLKKDDTIEQRSLDILKECMDSGIEFIIATGRDINMVIDLMKYYQFDCDLILNNGAQYCNLNQTFNDIYPMNNDAFLKAAHILNDYGYLLAIHTNQGKYSFHDQEAFWDYHMKLLRNTFDDVSLMPQKTFTTREGYLRDFHYAKTPEEIIEKGVKVLKIDARHIDISSVQGVKNLLMMPELDISSSYDDNIEITANVSNKGLLLEKVLNEKGYKQDEVAVFGDGENDSYMLERFPYSFAPSNSSELAKKAATYQLSFDFDEGAIYEGICLLKEKGLI